MIRGITPKLATLVAALAAAPLAQAQFSTVSVYGTLNLDVEAVRGTLPDGSNPTTFRVSSNSSNVGLRGSEALGGGLSAFFQVEYAVAPDEGGASQPLRDSFVGLQGDWGSLQLGYFLAPYDDVSPLFGSVPTYLTSILSTSTLWSQGAQSKQNGGFDTRLPNSIRYDAPIYNGFTGSVQLSLGESENTNLRTDHTLSLAGFYANGPLEVGLGYERNVEIRGPSLTDQALSFAGTWNFGTLRIGGVYERLRYETLSGDLTRNFWGVSATAALGPSGTFYAFYGHAGDGGGSAANGTRVGSLARGPDSSADQWMVSYTYRLSKRLMVYSGYNYIGNDANATYNFYVNRYPVAVGANPSGFVLGTAHSF
ncbi:MAG: porin [Betaproteobacteria bacterium]|nr:porin [Betaproteobacteria bacterium]